MRETTGEWIDKQVAAGRLMNPEKCTQRKAAIPLAFERLYSVMKELRGHVDMVAERTAIVQRNEPQPNDCVKNPTPPSVCGLQNTIDESTNIIQGCVDDLQGILARLEL